MVNWLTNNTGVKKNVRDYNKTTFALRLKGPEAVRYWKLMDKAKEANPYIDYADVNRELLGLSEPKLLTHDEIDYFRKGKEK